MCIRDRPGGGHGQHATITSGFVTDYNLSLIHISKGEIILLTKNFRLQMMVFKQLNTACVAVSVCGGGESELARE